MTIQGTHNIQVLRGLSTNRSLLSCNGDGSVVDLWNIDDSSGRQEWNVALVPGRTDEYHITVQKGVSGNRKFLSCTADGKKVDLWNTDDNSGRQRWRFKPVTNSPTPDTYTIEVSAGVSGNRNLLSCTADGKKVDLWNTDDNSGRQRWQIQGVWISA